jgi:hypothetical protein
MRGIFVSCAALVAAFLVYVSGPRFVASFGNLAGYQASQLAVVGEPLNTFSYERAVRSRERASQLVDHRLYWAELGLLHYNQFILAEQGAIEQFARGPLFAEAAVDAFEHSLTLTPVQPTAWLMLADLHLRADDRDHANEALEWSFRTGYFHRPLVERRAELAFLLWDDLPPLSRERLDTTLVELVRREPSRLAELSLNAGMAEDMMELLAEQDPDGPLLAARFYRAAGEYVGYASPLLRQLGDRAAMQRLLASAGLMVTVALPVPSFAMTVEEYLAINRGEIATFSESDVLRYLTGVLDAILMTGEVARMQGSPVFCMTEEQIMALQPGEVKVTLDLMLDQFQQEMPNFTELAQNRTVGVATLQLLTYLYPCESTELAN